MAKKHVKVFDSIFGEVPPSFGDEEDFMMGVTEIVPESEYFHEIINSRQSEKQLTLNLKKEALEWNSKGLAIYMLSDNPDIVHALALDKSYLPYVKFLKRNSKNNIESIDRIFSADIGSDYE